MEMPHWLLATISPEPAVAAMMIEPSASSFWTPFHA
jgi:hypothetical protein